jgi:hypothetical protein
MEASKMGAAHHTQINAGAGLYGHTANRAKSIVAGSGTSGIQDNFWHEGTAIDRTTPGLFLSGQGIVQVLPVLNTGETVTVERRYRHSDDAATWEELPSMPDDDASLALVTVTAAQMVSNTAPRTYRDNLDLAGAKKYIRQDIRINLSRANTDVCHTAGTIVLAGSDGQAVN